MKSPFALFAFALVVAAASAGPAFARQGGTIPPGMAGQFYGPVDLSLDPTFNSAYEEIAHLAVLPDVDATVVLWCQDHCNGVGATDSYLWKLAAPGRVDALPVPGTSLSRTPFCSGLAAR